MTIIERKHVTTCKSRIVRHAGVVHLCGQTASGTTIADVAGQDRRASGDRLA